jgi:hypothetical protein
LYCIVSPTWKFVAVTCTCTLCIFCCVHEGKPPSADVLWLQSDVLLRVTDTAICGSDLHLYLHLCILLFSNSAALLLLLLPAE